MMVEVNKRKDRGRGVVGRKILSCSLLWLEFWFYCTMDEDAEAVGHSA